MDAPKLQTPPQTPGPTDIPLAIRKALRGLQFGSVEIVVHDSKIVRIERRERIRLDSESNSPTATAEAHPSSQA